MRRVMPGMRSGRRLAAPGTLLAALAVAAGLTACGRTHPPAATATSTVSRGTPAASAARGPAAEAVQTFHARLDAADFAAIWSAADATFRSSVPRADYERFMTKLHGRLGRVVSTANVRSTPLQTADRATLLLAQNTTFEHGAGLETFTFLLTPKGAILLGYNLQSAVLAGS